MPDALVEGRWVTLHGAHVLLKEGQSVTDAIANLQNKSGVAPSAGVVGGAAKISGATIRDGYLAGIDRAYEIAEGAEAKIHVAVGKIDDLKKAYLGEKPGASWEEQYNYLKTDPKIKELNDECDALRKAKFAALEEGKAKLHSVLLLPEARRLPVKVFGDSTVSPQKGKLLQAHAEKLHQYIDARALERSGWATVGRASVEVSIEKGVRAHYSETGGMHLANTRPDVFAHEYGHQLESHNREIHQACRDFIRRRCGAAQEDREIQSLKVLSKGAGYREDERAAVPTGRKFISPYVGKFCRSRNTEVLSMGLEALMTRPISFARKDPEHFALTVDIIRGRWHSGNPYASDSFIHSEKIKV